MKAISIHQPWSWAILHAGKSIENRTWQTAYRGPLLIHASKSRASYDQWTPETWREKFGSELPPWDSLPKGAIVGVVELVGMIRQSVNELIDEKYAKWFEGPWGWRLENPRPFEKPTPYRGAQLIFSVPDELVQDLSSPSAKA